MFSDPLSAFKQPGADPTAIALARISTQPAIYRNIDGNVERELRITHSQSAIKGTSGTRKRCNIQYVMRKAVPADPTGCCTPGYTQIINANFSFDYAAGSPFADVQDVVKSLAVWLYEAGDAAVVDKLYNGES